MLVLYSLPQDVKANAAAAPLSGEQLYKFNCMACHMENGQGQPGLFPPLAGTDWVAGKKPDRLIRIILHGMVGPLKINGQPFFTTAPIMPPQASLSDDQIASILTYIRSAWKGSAAAVSADQVASIRHAEASRATPWTEDELHKIPVQ